MKYKVPENQVNIQNKEKGHYDNPKNTNEEKPSKESSAKNKKESIKVPKLNL